MAIYGTALLSVCLLTGALAGQVLGRLLGIDANVGGVGIAMLLLILVCDWCHQTGRLPVPSQRGILFWSSIYIPIVVAMAASQDVVAAMQGGPIAMLAGTLAVLVCFLCVPLLSRLGSSAGDPVTLNSPTEEGDE